MDKRHERLAESLVCARERDFSVKLLHRKLKFFAKKKRNFVSKKSDKNNTTWIWMLTTATTICYQCQQTYEHDGFNFN